MHETPLPGRRESDGATRVQYDNIAEQYHQGRVLSDPVLDAWRDAVLRFLPTVRPLTVLDIGAGTGIFTRAWTRWCDCRVVAVEPSDGMRHAARLVGIPTEAAIVAGVGEAISVRDHSVDVAWLFTVLNHLRDTGQCVEELRRVVVSTGVVPICGVFADLGDVGWLPYSPGGEVVRSTFPSAADTVALFDENGFRLLEALQVESRIHQEAADAAIWARQMRHADSLLNSFGDADFEAGIAALDAAPGRPIVNRLVLLAFNRSRPVVQGDHAPDGWGPM